MTSRDDIDLGLEAARPYRLGSLRQFVRYGLALLIVLGAVAMSCLVMVGAGQAVVITEFGKPVRVLTTPGLAWKLPAPIEGTIPVDLRLLTTSSGLQDVGTRDGLRILVQAYVAWRVPADPRHIKQFLRTVSNDPDGAARQLRSFIGSALQITASNFDLNGLVNTDTNKVKLGEFERQLQANAAKQILDIYGVTIDQVGVERLSLPAQTLAATVARMRSERETVAAQRTAEGLRVAAQIRSDAQRDAHITEAQAQAQAASIEADSRRKAAEIYAKAYNADPALYTMLRSLDTVSAVVGPKTRLVLRTDAAPFNVLVQGPPEALPQQGACTTSAGVPGGKLMSPAPKGGKPRADLP
ncbi:MAG TPA: protease modulator HflC [Stellaceae bacterium]|nr:protease modulator HflC [Stellaceae bacterium]